MTNRINPDPHGLLLLEAEPLESFPRHAAQFATAFGAVAFSRSYATDQTSEIGGVAIARAVWRTQKQAGSNDNSALAELLKRVAPLVSTAVQAWRPEPERPTPALWTDPWGRELANPFDASAVDLKGQARLRQSQPELAELLANAATSPYELVARLEDQRAARATLRALKFTKAEFERNPFRRDPNEPGAMEAQGAFVRDHSPAVVDAYRKEAAAVRWPWGVDGNRSELGRCVMILREPVGPIDANVLFLAGKINAALVDGLRRQAADEQRAAAQRAAALAPVR